MDQQALAYLFRLQIVFIRVIEPGFGRDKDKHSQRDAEGPFPERGYGAFVEGMLFAHAGKEHDKSGKCLDYPPGTLKDDVRQIPDLHCLSVENSLIVIERDS